MNSRKKKSFFLGGGLIATSLVLSLSLTSCSSVLNEYLKKTISIGNGDSFYDTIGDGSLKQITLDALKSQTGRNELLAYINGLISIKIIEKLQEDEKNGKNYKNEYENQKEKIDKDYKDLVDRYKKEHKDGWALKFQQDVLDPVGGTVESYKKDKLISWATSYLNTKIFKNFYVSLWNSSNNLVKNPTQNDVKNILSATTTSSQSTTNNAKLYKFSDQAINSQANTLEGKIFASIQQIIFDNWVTYENPYVVNMSLWKYGTPKNGLSSLYINASDSNTTTDDEGNQTTTTNSASYSFPYFADDNGTNTTPSTVSKFNSFIEAAKTKANFITDTTNGLKDIPLEYTDDKSTLILVKNGSVYTDLVPEFASAASYLYGTLLIFDKGGLTNNDSRLQKGLSGLATTTTTDFKANTTNSVIGFDAITKEFLSTTNTSSFTQELKLPSDYINNTFTSGGVLKDNRNKDLYVVDGFKVSDTQLNQFMFIRNSFGVHAVSIDGKEYLQKATDTVDLKSKSADIVMYHYFNNIYGFNNYFSIDLQTEMSNYYNNNISQVLIDYALNKSDSQISLDTSIFGVSDDTTVTTLIKNLVNYYTLEKSSNRKIDYQKALAANKKTYSNTNYGQTADLNGLATPFIYIPETDDPYDFDFTTLSLPKIDKSKTYIQSLEDAKKQNDSSIDAYYNAIKESITSLKSNFEGYKYSQYIYTNNEILNKVLLAYGNSVDINLKIKNDILSKSLNGKYKYSFSRTLPTNQVSQTSTDASTTQADYVYTGEYKSNFVTNNTNLNDGIDQGLSNYFYSKTFVDGDASRWLYYSDLMASSSTSKTSTSSAFDVNSLNNYRNKLWSYSSEYVNKNYYSSMNDLYSLLVTIDYLVQDNYSQFVKYLQDTITLTNNAYLLWANSYNFEIEEGLLNTDNVITSDTKSTDQKTIQDLLDSDNIKRNLNNLYSSLYFGQPSINNKDLNNNVYPDATYTSNENYYVVSGGRLGFYGLQVANSAAVPTTIGNLIFNDPLSQNYEGVGVLNSYGTKENLINYVNSLSTISSIDSLANTLFKFTGTFVKENILNEKGIDLKKEIFVRNINDSSQIKDVYFQPRNSYIGLEKVTTTTGKQTTTKTYEPIIDPENNRVKHGGYVIQLNSSNIKDFNTFYNYVKTNINSLDSISSTTTDTNNQEKNTYDVIGNLIVKAAMDSNIQKMAIDRIAVSNKINVYDIRIYNDLGSTYVKNWKW